MANTAICNLQLLTYPDGKHQQSSTPYVTRMASISNLRLLTLPDGKHNLQLLTNPDGKISNL